MDREMFEEMIENWQADNAPMYNDLIIDKIELNDGEWIAIAHDDKTTYQLNDDGTGNIAINYIGAN